MKTLMPVLTQVHLNLYLMLKLRKFPKLLMTFLTYKHLVADWQVLIQPMLTNVGAAVFHDANGAAYVCINWADSDDTEAVTAVKKLKYCQISSTGKHVPPEHKQVFDLVREVYKITSGTPVDIEFAITESKGNTRIWLLQARPLIIVPKVENIDDHSKRLVMLEKHLKEHLAGNRS